MTDDAHWNEVYGSRAEDEVSWFAETPEPSLSLVCEFAQDADPVADIGGGASWLADALLARGYGDLTVLDLSGRAIDMARARLGARAGDVHWIVGDVTRWQPGRTFRLWHDRAVFHFLTGAPGRAAYARVMRAALEPGGHSVISTFAEDGPEHCSGLPVARYAPAALAREIERHAPGAFEPVRALRHAHVTPAGATQRFQVSVFRRLA
ncbi:MAG: class I SAM-dependent methyltransferase [Jhaorihella sp.]